ncbi:Oidioi.mRNA.OKI2018_I69.chr2.g6822.t1.cds [Oikopleura dioica]|uniref:Oidioi.mRNA.OKI2018_I69.chr2.g6822.t1.cds n=1 Tax=Oikopleura dioica TaxID=34765 RepID=A0ABN7TDG8_OIKDI|nr:Oidioi.mRNA.OKI2018_I69.chr2.g6822.t1.cds [Oikopleura dioica]
MTKSLSEQFNEKLDELGHFGPFQIKTFLLLALSTIPCGWHAYSQTILSYEPTYNITTNNAQCKRFNYGDETFENKDDVHQFHLENLHNLVDCEPDDDFWFNTSDTISATTEWQTICSKQWQQDFDTQSFMLGKLAGAFIFGAMSDAVGRFKTYFISLVLQLATGILIAIAPNVLVYSIARFAEGAACSGVYLCAYVLALEFIGPDKRTTPGLIYHMFYAIGYSLLAPIGNYIKDFRTVSWVLAIPSAFALPLYFIIDESVQWLLGKRRIDDAEKIVLKAADGNKKVLEKPVFVDDKEDKEGDEKNKGQCAAFADMFVDVFSGPYPKLRRRILSLFLIWPINSGSYYGITLNAKNLSGNFYLNLLISGLTEIPAILFVIFSISKWDIGRKKILMFTYALCAGLMGLIAVIQAFHLDGDGNMWSILVIIPAMGGKFAISGAYAVIYLFSTEQVPTVVKNSCLGVCSICARFGGLLCPYIISLANYWKPLPLIIFASVSVVAFVLMIPLPETHKKVLPQTLEEAESFGFS